MTIAKAEAALEGKFMDNICEYSRSQRVKNRKTSSLEEYYQLLGVRGSVLQSLTLSDINLFQIQHIVYTCLEISQLAPENTLIKF